MAAAAAAAPAGEPGLGRGEDGDGAGAAMAAGAPPPARLALVEAGDWARGARDCSCRPAPLPLAVGGREWGPRQAPRRPPTPHFSVPPFSHRPVFEHLDGRSSSDVRASQPIVQMGKQA